MSQCSYLSTLDLQCECVFEIFEFGSFRLFIDFVCDNGGPVDEFHNLEEVLLIASSGCHGWAANSDPRRNERAFVSWDCIFIDGDRQFIHDCFHPPSIYAFASHINHEQMIIGSSRDESVPFAQQILARLFAVQENLNKHIFT